MKTISYDELALSFGRPVAVIDAGQRVIIVTHTNNGEVRVARLNKRIYCPCTDACEQCRMEAKYVDALDLMYYCTTAEFRNLANLRDAFDFISDEKWVTREQTPKAYRELWLTLVTADTGAPMERAADLYDSIFDPTPAGKVKVTDAYVGDKGTLLITGSRSDIEDLAQSLTK